jgi:hypothetical protein
MNEEGAESKSIKAMCFPTCASSSVDYQVQRIWTSRMEVQSRSERQKEKKHELVLSCLFSIKPVFISLARQARDAASGSSANTIWESCVISPPDFAAEKGKINTTEWLLDEGCKITCTHNFLCRAGPYTRHRKHPEQLRRVGRRTQCAFDFLTH